MIQYFEVFTGNFLGLCLLVVLQKAIHQLAQTSNQVIVLRLLHLIDTFSHELLHDKDVFVKEAFYFWLQFVQIREYFFKP